MRIVGLAGKFFVWSLFALLAWDIYDYGPSKSVAVNAGITLAERVGEASKGIPDLVQAGVERVNRLLDRRGDVASASIFPFIYAAPQVPKNLDEDTLWAIQLASRRTGISTDYLLTTAYMEANFSLTARSPTSSAAGMYQFIDSTWLSLMREHGHDYGWAGYAEQIACTSAGRCKYQGSDGATKVMDLRYDGMTATFLSAELARSNKADLEKALGRDVIDAELYMAHFLGVDGAIRLMNTMRDDPAVTAASLFPDGAKANRNLFYRNRHAAFTCGAFYQNLKKRWDTSARAIALDPAAGEKALEAQATPSS